MSLPEALVVRGTAHRLPPDARAVLAPVPRPLPGAPPGLLGVVVLEGRLLPAWCWDDAPAAWVLLRDGLVGGSALGPAAPGAPWLCLPEALATPPDAVPRAVAPHPAGRAPASLATPLATPSAATVVLRLGGATLAVPMAALLGIRPWPARLVPVPGRPAGALGYAEVTDGPVLVLEPAWCFGGPAREMSGHLAPGHLAVLLHGGRRLGLPCHGAAPGSAPRPGSVSVSDGMALLSRLDGTLQGAGLLALAPRPAVTVPAAPMPRRALLLCRAGTARFFLAAEVVESVVPPQRPRPLPGVGLAVGNLAGEALSGGGLAKRGLVGACAHRGLVLPVRDATRHLGAGAGTGPAPAALPPAPPMLHVAGLSSGAAGGASGIALAVSEVLGLRRVPVGDITPVAGDALVEALVLLEGEPVPLCRAAALAAP